MTQKLAFKREVRIAMSRTESDLYADEQPDNNRSDRLEIVFEERELGNDDDAAYRSLREGTRSRLMEDSDGGSGVDTELEDFNHSQQYVIMEED